MEQEEEEKTAWHSVMVYERDAALGKTEQHDGSSAPAIHFLVAAQEAIQDIGLGYFVNQFVNQISFVNQFKFVNHKYYC